MTYYSEKRKANAESMRQKIYDVAAKMFLEKDYHNVSIDDIVNAAGVAKGSFYVHFESKDALLAQIVADRVYYIDADYRAFLESFPKESSAEEQLYALVNQIASVLDTKIGCENMKIIYKAQLVGENVPSSVMSYHRDIYNLFQIIIERGKANGEFKKTIDTSDLLHHLMIAMRGVTFEWCIRCGNLDYQKETQNLFRLIIEGILDKKYKSKQIKNKA